MRTERRARLGWHAVQLRRAATRHLEATCERCTCGIFVFAPTHLSALSTHTEGTRRRSCTAPAQIHLERMEMRDRGCIHGAGTQTNLRGLRRWFRLFHFSTPKKKGQQKKLVTLIFSFLQMLNIFGGRQMWAQCRGKAYRGVGASLGNGTALPAFARTAPLSSALRSTAPCAFLRSGRGSVPSPLAGKSRPVIPKPASLFAASRTCVLPLPFVRTFRCRYANKPSASEVFIYYFSKKNILS